VKISFTNMTTEQQIDLECHVMQFDTVVELSFSRNTLESAPVNVFRALRNWFGEGVPIRVKTYLGHRDAIWQKMTEGHDWTSYFLRLES